MKKIVFVLTTLVLLISCSSDDNGNDTAVGGEDAFTLNFEGEEFTITSWQAVKVETRLAVVGRADNGRTVAIEFNEFGNFSYASTYSTQDPSAGLYTSFNLFAANYFNFEFVGIDQTTKRVSVNFSGDIYDDEYDITSEKKSISGGFNVPYTEEASPVTNFGLSTKIGSADWNYTSSFNNGGFFSGSNISMNYTNDDAYTVSIEVNHDNTETGTYNFTENTAYNKVKIYKYNPDTNNSTEFTTSGTINITEKTSDNFSTVIRGTFNLTAMDPTNNNSILITEGVFTGFYNNY